MARSPPRQSTLDIENILTDYYEPANNNPYQKRASATSVRSRHDSIPLPPFTRTLTTQSTSSTYTVNSTTDLVGGHLHASKYHEGSFSWPWHAQDNSDREKMAGSSEKGPDVNKPAMRLWEGWRVVVLGSWMNVLLALLPASWIVEAVVEESRTLVFIFCILSMVPLVRLHDLATSELALRMGGSKAGLLNASMSNIVEIVVATTALRKCQLRVVQSSLIGSMLSKLLLVLGMCFFAGGLRFSEQAFESTTTQIHSSLLSISVGAVLLPAAYHFSLSGGEGLASNEQKRDILQMSHGVAVILLIIYICYLLFQLYSHTHLYKDHKSTSNRHDLKSLRPLNLHITVPSASSFRLDKGRNSPGLYQSTAVDSRESSPRGPQSRTNSYSGPPRFSSPSPYTSASNSISEIIVPATNGGASASSSTVGLSYPKGKAMPAPALNSTVKLVNDGRHTPSDSASRVTRTDSETVVGHSQGVVHFDEQAHVDIGESPALDEKQQAKEEKEHKTKEPKLSWPLTMALLVVVTVLVAINAEWLVESMDGISTTIISKEWIGLILLPAVSSIAECVTTINVSRKDQLTLSIGVAVGSTIQTALFVIPFMVILGWILNKPLALLFDPFESVVMYISVHTMGYVVADGKSNWLEGAILICLYMIIAVCFWFYPGSTFSSTLAACQLDHSA